MPHVLILHASLGTGHISAANALAAAYRRSPGVEVRVHDVLDSTSELVRSALNTFYLQTSEKAPSLYKLLYENTESDKVDDPLGSDKLLGIVGPPFFLELQKRIKQTAPDLIVSVHPLAVQVVHHLVERRRYTGLHYVVVTDFVAHRTWMATGVDGYFVPSNLTGEMLAERGVPRDKLRVTGIPVNLAITEPKDPLEMRRKHQLSTESPLIALFGGGIAVERVRRMVTRLLEYDGALQLVVVAGRNRELHNALADLTSKGRVQLLNLGKIDYVDDLIAASDFVITKAGGLIVSEILARSTPMLIIDPIPGQEEWNADFVAGAGAAIQLRMPEMVPPTAEYLLHQPERIAAMGAQARLVGHPYAALEIAQATLDELRIRESQSVFDD